MTTSLQQQDNQTEIFRLSTVLLSLFKNFLSSPYLSKDSTSEPKENEMSIDEHIKLANLLNNSKSYVVLSGHPSTLYNRLYKDWDCVKKNGRITKRRKDRRIECIWKNY